MSQPQKIPVRAAEISVGVPLPWAVYDESGALLLNRGMAPSSQHQVESLIARGLYRNCTGTAPATATRQSGALRVSAAALGPHPPASSAGDPIPFDELALRPGELLQVHSALEVAGDFVPVALLGFLKNQSLIITHPRVGGKPMLLADGAPLNIKALSGTNLFTFKAKVLKAFAQPFAHLHLEYPGHVHAIKIRKALRAVVNLPAELHDPVTHEIIPVVLKDLSAGGAQLVLPALMGKKGAAYGLRFKASIADDLEADVCAPVTVRAIAAQDIKGVPTHTMGVQFQELPREARLLVMTLVYRQQLTKG